jgi:regulator of RNase E activity RraA
MNTLWKDDDELFALAERELFSAVIGDIMDKMRMLHQFLPPNIQPLERNMAVAGRAMTVLEADLPDDGAAPGQDPGSAEPFGLMLRALDSLRSHEVYVCAGASPQYALWGELMSARAIRCGAAGAVLDGYSRDTRPILALGFPTFSLGSYAQDQAPRGKVTDFRIPIQIGETRISPGDIVFGDMDGVCIVPRPVEVEVFSRALEKARKEKHARKAIEAGMSAMEAFQKFGVL